MIAYIKDRKTFQTLDLMLELSQYNLILGAVNNNVGTALCSYEVEGLENQFFIFDNRLWIVKSLSPDNGHTLISLYDISYLFARDLIWDENNSYTTIEECIADTIDTEFINLSDTEYDTPYITVSYTTATPFIMPDTENGLWNLKAYIAKVRRVKNVFLDYTISRNALLIDIEQRTPNVWRFDFATDVAQMSQETYQKTSTAKITVNGTTDYYLYTDGTYGNDPDLKDRAEGDWVQLQVSDNESEADKVADVFSKNSESRIIEFYTDAPVEFYDSVILRHEGRVTSGTLSTVSISSSDNRRYCKTGDLINTVPEAISVLSERIEKVTKTVERATESQNIQGDFSVSGDIYEGGVKLEDKYAPIGFNGGDIYTVVSTASGEPYALIIGGLLTSATKSIYFTIQTPKSMAVVNPSITSLRINPRHSGGGYMIGSSYVSGGTQVVGVSGYTITAHKTDDYHITITIKRSSVYNGTNNTPCVVQVDELIISFS